MQVDDVVMVNVRSIAEMGAYVTLSEYNDIEGMILLSEVCAPHCFRCQTSLTAFSAHDCYIPVQFASAVRPACTHGDRLLTSAVCVGYLCSTTLYVRSLLFTLFMMRVVVSSLPAPHHSATLPHSCHVGVSDRFRSCCVWGEVSAWWFSA